MFVGQLLGYLYKRLAQRVGTFVYDGDGNRVLATLGG